MLMRLLMLEINVPAGRSDSSDSMKCTVWSHVTQVNTVSCWKNPIRYGSGC